ncbi:MAG: HlyC/CorC family transporter [Cryobacterium sp.]|nr:HlyC/CorC family transporter [Oligoflexia bacterium]
METLSTLLVLILIAISGFLSGSEIALFSLSKVQLKHLRERFKPSYRLIKKLLSDPTGVLVTILICNEVSNIAISTLVSEAVANNHGVGWFAIIGERWLHRLPPWGIDLVLGAVLTSPIVLIFCEITPKIIAARTNTLVAPLTIGPLHLLYQIMAPIRMTVIGTQRLVAKMIPGKNPEQKMISTRSKLREEDFLTMVEEAQKEGTVGSSELQLIRNVFDLDDTAVSEIATPLSRTFMLPQTTSLSQALISMRDGSSGQRYSRVPVYGKNRSDVVGLLYSKDLLVAKLEKADLATPISEYMWKPFFVSAVTRLNSLFRKMKRQRVHLAMVTNAQGASVGVVTMNDVLEALLDELLIDDDEEDEL